MEEDGEPEVSVRIRRSTNEWRKMENWRVSVRIRRSTNE
jgi:hypothetical protein